MRPPISWRLVLLAVAILIAALLAAGQAITFAWLSSFPERASRFAAYEINFWCYGTASVVLIGAEIALLWHIFKRRNKDT